MAGGMSGSDAYFLSCDIDLNVKLKIGVLLDERKPAEQHQQSLDELETEMADDEYSKARRLSSLLHVQGRYEYYVTCQLFADNGSPISLPARTKHASFSSQEVKWSEWLTLPVKYCDLPVDAVAAITVWDVVGPLQVAAIGGTTVPLFDRQNMELQGQTGGMKLQLWPHCQADPAWRTTTPYQIRSPNDMDRLSGLEKEYDSGSMPRLDWLDRLAFQAIDRTKKQIKQTDDRFFVSIEFPMLQLPVLFFEKAYTAEAAARSKVIRKQRSQLLLDHKLTLPAVDFGKRDVENPVQLKHRVMSRIDQDSNSKSERDLTPSRQEKDDIARILLDSPIASIVETDQELIWKYRHYLSNHEMAMLPKFCRTVQWGRPAEERQSLELMTTGAAWKRTSPAVALELLTKTFSHHVPREFAVECLDR